MKRIKLWYPSHVTDPLNLLLDDDIASGLVRAGVAAAADPAEAGSLGSGGTVSAATPVTISVQEGTRGEPRRIVVPAAVAAIAASGGRAAIVSVGVTVAPTPTPPAGSTLTLGTGTMRATMQPGDLYRTVTGIQPDGVVSIVGVAADSKRLAVNTLNQIVVGDAGPGTDGTEIGAYTVYCDGPLGRQATALQPSVATAQRFFPFKQPATTNSVLRSVPEGTANPYPLLKPAMTNIRTVVIMGYIRLESQPASSRALFQFLNQAASSSSTVQPRMWTNSTNILRMQTSNASAYSRDVGTLTEDKWYYVCGHIDTWAGRIECWLNDVQSTAPKTAQSNNYITVDRFAGFETAFAASPAEYQFGYWWAMYSDQPIPDTNFGSPENYAARSMRALDSKASLTEARTITFRSEPAAGGQLYDLTADVFIVGPKLADFNANSGVINYGALGGKLYKPAIGTFANGSTTSDNPLTFFDEAFELAPVGIMAAGTAIPTPSRISAVLTEAKPWRYTWNGNVLIDNSGGGSRAGIASFNPPGTLGQRPLETGVPTAALPYHGAMQDWGNAADAIAYPNVPGKPDNSAQAIDGWRDNTRLRYEAALQRDPALTGSEISGSINKSIIKGASKLVNLAKDTMNNQLTDLRAFHLRDDIPAFPATSLPFDPPYAVPNNPLWLEAVNNYDTTKTADVNAANDTAINLSVWPTLPTNVTNALTGLPSVTKVLNKYAYIHDTWSANHDQSKATILPGDFQELYGRDYSQFAGACVLMLCLPTTKVPVVLKKHIARAVIHQAIQLTGAWEAGRRMTALGLGNTSTGRRILLAAGALMTGEQRMINALNDLGWMAEDQQYGYVQQKHIDRAPAPLRPAFPQSMLGKAWWTGSGGGVPGGWLGGSADAGTPAWWGTRRGPNGSGVGTQWPDGTQVLGGNGEHDNGAEYMFNNAYSLFMTYVMLQFVPALKTLYNHPALCDGIELIYRMDRGLVPRPDGITITSLVDAYTADTVDKLTDQGVNNNARIIREHPEMGIYFSA